MDPAAILSGHLYLGSQLSAKDRDVLYRLNIRYIINAAKEVSNFFENETDKFTYYSCKLEDDPEEKLEVHFQSVFGIIEVAKQQGHGVLVHCQAGISRSASLVIAYLMRENKMTLREAFLLTKEKRPVVQPNSGFMEQLMELDKKLYGSVSFSVHDFYTAVLVDMGFSEGKAKRCLLQRNNDFDQALGMLLFGYDQ